MRSLSSRRTSRHVRIYGMAMKIKLGTDETKEENKAHATSRLKRYESVLLGRRHSCPGETLPSFALKELRKGRRGTRGCCYTKPISRVFNASWYQTMKQINLSGDNFDYYREAEFDSFRQALDGFNGTVGRLLEQGILAVEAVRAGRDPAPFLREMYKIYGDYGKGKLSQIGIPIPSDLQILDAAATVLETKAQELMRGETEARKAVERIIARQNRPDFAGGGGSSGPTQAISAERQSFIDQWYAKYAAEPMYGLDGKTIIGYGGVLGTTVANSNADESNLHGAAVDQVSQELYAATNFQWVANAYESEGINLGLWGGASKAR